MEFSKIVKYGATFFAGWQACKHKDEIKSFATSAYSTICGKLNSVVNKEEKKND